VLQIKWKKTLNKTENIFLIPKKVLSLECGKQTTTLRQTIMKTIAKFKTSKGNEIQIYTTSLIGENGCVVFDKSCLIERTYLVGQNAYLNWEQFENGYQKVKSIKQVVNAWKNEEIHF